MTRWNWGRRETLRWITNTLLVSIIPVILFGTIIYYLGSWIVQQEVHRASQESLTQVRHQVETKLGNIEQLSNQIVMQSDLIRLLNIETSPALGAFMQSNTLRSDLSSIKNSTEGIQSIYFYHAAQQIIITDDTITSLYEDRVFRDLSWLDELEAMVGQRVQRSWVAPRMMVSDRGSASRTLTQITVLPFFYQHPKAALIINLRPSFVTDTIARFPLGADGKLLVFNEQGERIGETAPGSISGEAISQILKSFPKDATGSAYTHRHEGSFLTTVVSSVNGWQYAMLVPADVPRQQVEFFRQIIILITALLCVMVVCSAYFSHSRFQRGIRRIMEKLAISRPQDPVHDQGEDAFLRIEEHIGNLLQEVKDERSIQQKHLPLLRAHYLHSLLQGNAVDVTRLAERQAEWGMLPYNRHCVLAVQMDARPSGSFHDDQGLFLFAVANIAGELAAEDSKAYLAEAAVSPPYAVVLFNYASASVAETQVVEYADRLRTVVKKILKQSVTIGVGAPVDSLAGIVHTYREAQQALRMNWVNAADEVLPFTNTTLVAEKLAQYPSADEQALLEALRDRNREAAQAALARFAAKLESGRTSVHMAKTFYMQLLVALIRLVQEFDDDLAHVFGGRNPYETFVPMQTTAQIHRWLSAEVVDGILEFMNSVKRSRTEVLIRDTLVWIRERYATDLSLQSAAERAGISPSYLSQLFKEEVGASFSQYVTALRVERAEELLQQTDLNLSQIAEAIGYTSVQQLFRVFKKKHGKTPGEYREHRLD
ncbi:AraC family transcriptional regulator [Paenibacillus sp. IB182496]|uniref:AraC family transcriptional regulator n=1 Tax=Paenibacillus sabuli TaxID=2772509 RepID=A0A927GV36_9BACL|nr:helix-turn-helix domain-containing protein [Paenibacillus sabuli]MBD2848342.1 AraC family transcriptional regulator [Paenibacillus sabuli]